MGTPRGCRGRSPSGVNGCFTRHVPASSRDLRWTKGSRVRGHVLPLSLTSHTGPLKEEFSSRGMIDCPCCRTLGHLKEQHWLSTIWNTKWLYIINYLSNREIEVKTNQDLFVLCQMQRHLIGNCCLAVLIFLVRCEQLFDIVIIPWYFNAELPIIEVNQ